MTETPNSGDISTKLRRIRKLGEEDPQRVFHSLHHHIDLDLLREAYRQTRKDGAAGVDGMTAARYSRNLEENLESLLSRFKSGTYFAPAVRRVHIPKGNGKTRPLGIPTLEDKVLQRAVQLVLTEIYEPRFHPGSMGFRPGRSQHRLLGRLWKGLMDLGGGWVLDVDVKAYFDTLDHSCLRAILDQRVRDGVLRRTIDKWLKAGVLETGQLSYPTAGTPQGGVISPLLANVYLDEVLDAWYERDVKPRMRGRSFLLRYADDFILVFEEESDARRVMEVLPARFCRYGLTVHPEKTRLVRFQRPRRRGARSGKGLYGDGERPGTFDILGFTHYWGRSRTGSWVVKRRTKRGSLNRALKEVGTWCRAHRHRKVADQHRTLAVKISGHYQYFGVRTNFPSLKQFYEEVKRIWRFWLSRRSQRAPLTWERYAAMLRRYPIPRPKIYHKV